MVTFNLNKVDIHAGSKKLGEGSDISLSFNPDSVFIYIGIGKNRRTYWVGNKKGSSAKLHIKFIDAKKQININNYKVKFNRVKDYQQVKNRATKAGYSDSIKFKSRK